MEHIIQELERYILRTAPQALNHLSLVPSHQPRTAQIQYIRRAPCWHVPSDLPNPNTLSAGLHCWRIKWKHRGKDVELPSAIYEALHLPDIKSLPMFMPCCRSYVFFLWWQLRMNAMSSRKHLKAYLRNALTDQGQVTWLCLT